ncbi:Pr6Pr family membrane protein [Streptacidiphilus cavernicola]|uniref:Pr6Pr family membrane protein n=1 Tax=Streptacidiphilus cavernicola TaxID=3342716 RepID=A0ABV6W5V3_9ACTN
MNEEDSATDPAPTGSGSADAPTGRAYRAGRWASPMMGAGGRRPAAGPPRRSAVPRWVPVLRIGFAVLTGVALGVTAAHAHANGGSLVNFFSYFTVLSNCAATVVLGYGGVAELLGRPGAPDLVRGAATLYLAVTGLVYAVALSGAETGMLAWTNDVLHRVIPLVLLADWLLLPPLRRLRWSEAAGWLVFPVLYLGYTLLRGPHARWYPYPFLDPRQHGYVRVAVSSVLVTLAFLALGALIVWVGNARRAQLDRRRADR